MTESEFSVEAGKSRQMVMATLSRLNPSQAEDLWQDTLLRAFARLHTFRGDCRFSTWLCRIAMNTATMYWRGVGHRIERQMLAIEPTLPIFSRTPSPEAALLAAERSQLADVLVSGLPAKLERVVRLQMDGLGLKATARALGVTVAAVKSRRVRAIRRLRRAAIARTKCEKVRLAAPHPR